jgi:hypothetical protein
MGTSFNITLFLSALKPTKPHIRCVLRAPSPVKSAQIVKLTTRPFALPTLRLGAAISSRPSLYHCVVLQALCLFLQSTNMNVLQRRD